MITQKDIDEAREREKLQSTAYLENVVDFVKWTSTVAIATILWVGNALTSFSGMALISGIAGLFSLICSIAMAILVIRRVLTAQSTEWIAASESYGLYLLKQAKAYDLGKVTEEKEVEQINRLIKALDASKPFLQPKGFARWVAFHTILLLVGLLLYVVAQLLSML